MLERLAPSVPLVAVTNAAASTLARRAAVVIDTFAGAELGVATRTYTAALLALHALAARMLGESQFAAVVAPALAQVHAVAAAAPAFVAGLDEAWFDEAPIIVVGRGPALATAHSGALVLKETARRASEARQSFIFTVSGASSRVSFSTTEAISGNSCRSARRGGISKSRKSNPGATVQPHSA